MAPSASRHLNSVRSKQKRRANSEENREFEKRNGKQCLLFGVFVFCDSRESHQKYFDDNHNCLLCKQSMYVSVNLKLNTLDSVQEHRNATYIYCKTMQNPHHPMNSILFQSQRMDENFVNCSRQIFSM